MMRDFFEILHGLGLVGMLLSVVSLMVAGSIHFLGFEEASVLLANYASAALFGSLALAILFWFLIHCCNA
jgi:hypothetical protein